MKLNLLLLNQLCRMALGCACAAGSLPGICQVYFGEAPGGAVTLSNFQSEAAPALLMPSVAERHSMTQGETKVKPGPARTIPAKAGNLLAMIDSIASTVEVAPRLLHAVISVESNYDAKAVSPRGAVGLMQLLPATAKRFGVTDPFIERDNVYAGASYLKWLIGYFDGDIELVLAAYNAGEQAVVKAGRKIPQYPETQAYVRRVMANLKTTGTLPL